MDENKSAVLVGEAQERPGIKIHLNLHLSVEELVSRLLGGSKGQFPPENES